MRITKKLLREMVENLNKQTGRNFELKYNAFYGYSIDEPVGDFGGVLAITGGMTASEMHAFLRGIQQARIEKLI